MEHLFTGKERDAESGNDYFGARYYASSTGRFLSPDWSAKVEPVPYSKLDNPQTLNLYAYVGNNPMDRTDPDGHTCIGPTTCGLEAGAAIGTFIEPGGGTAVGAVIGAAVGGAITGYLLGKAILHHIDQSQNSSETPLPKGIVGTDPKPTDGSRTKSGPLAPEHGGSGDAGKDFGTLTGGKSAPAAPEKRYPAGTRVGENGIALRPATGKSGPKIDIPANGSKPHETLHYPPPPPPPPQP